MRLMANGLWLVLAGWMLTCSSAQVEDRLPEVPLALRDTTVAFVDVHVIPMDTERVLENQTVIIRQGKIVDIGPTATLTPPEEAVRIDASGHYLMPGLADMHVHYTSTSTRDLLLYLANGVTTVRFMWGGNTGLTLREQVRTGETLGPHIVVASPGLEGPTTYWPLSIQLHTPQEGRIAVHQLKAQGYDFIKMYNSVPLAIYDAVLDEAQRENIRVIGHIPSGVSVPHALEKGHASIAHLIDYPRWITTTGSRSWSANLDTDKMRQIAEATRDAGTWNGPTFTVLSRTRADIAAIKNSDGWRYLSPQAQQWFDDPRTQPPANRDPRQTENRQRFVKVLHDVGAGLLLGTDTGVQYVLPGYAIHEELQFLADAGLTPYQVYRMGTVQPAEFLNRTDRGTIAVGQEADLVLLKRNPLDDVAHFAERIGVMVHGDWFSETHLQTLLATATNE